jgi:Esterase-like activity of phytase
MRISLLCSVASLVLASTAAFAQGEGEFPAKLAGHAVLPAQSFIDAPADAPDDLKTSGKYTTGRRVDAIGSVMGKSNDRPTGVSLPFKGQPLQGHSGIKVMPDGSFWVITDNGMGSRTNSPDSMLYLNRHKIDWSTGKVERQETVFLHDPDKKVPFRIVHEDTTSRYLTGADFDTEGFQIIGDTFWIGDEFGPYILKADRNGKVLAVSRPWPTASRCARRTTGRCNRRARRARATPTSTCAAPRAMKASLRPRTANSCTACSKARCGMPRRRIGKRSTARKPRGFSNSTSLRKSSPAAIAICVRAERQRHRRLQHDRCRERPDHRT